MNAPARQGPTRKQTVGWALYDWANSAFVTTVITAIFPLFYKGFVYNAHDVGATSAAGLIAATSALLPADFAAALTALVDLRPFNDAESTSLLAAAAAISSFIIAILAPPLGAIADAGFGRKRFLTYFMLLGVVACALLLTVTSGDWYWALACYALGRIGFAGANVFYDSLLYDNARAGKADSLSAIGFAVGYLGGGLQFALCAFMAVSPETFGFANKLDATYAAFAFTALWWLLFSMPALLWMRETRGEKVGFVAASRQGFTRLKATFKELKQYRAAVWFLLAYWLYIDGVHTIIVMASALGTDFGLDAAFLIKALLVTQFVGFPATLVVASLSRVIAPRVLIAIGVALYIGVTSYVIIIKTQGGSGDPESDFMVLAILVGLVQGTVQAMSRSFFQSLIPAEKSAEFFGFYNMLGKSATILGPALIAIIATMTGSSALGLAGVVVLLVAGLVVLLLAPISKYSR